MEPAPNHEDVVRLTVPAALEYVRIVRMTVSGVASRLGFDVEEIDNLRVAIDELASMVVEVAAAGTLELEFATTPDGLRIEGRAPAARDANVTVDELTAQILNAVSDKYEFGATDGMVAFSCLRRLPTV